MAAKNGTGSILAIKQYTRALMPFSVEQERLEELRQRCLRKDWLNVPIKFVFISLAVGCLGFFIASASCGLGMSFVCGVVAFWVTLLIFSMIHGTAKGIKDGYLQGDAEDSDDAEQIYTPNLNGWVRWIWLILGKTQRFWLRSS